MDRAGNLVGNGAYTLTEHKPGEKAVVTRNPMPIGTMPRLSFTSGSFLTVNDEFHRLHPL